MSVKQWAEEDRPSTKLLNLGANTLTNAELISILVGSGTAHHNAVEIAQAILSRYDRDLSKLGKADLRELKEIDGVGTYTICKIMAAIELGKPSPDKPMHVANIPSPSPVTARPLASNFAEKVARHIAKR